MQNKDDWFEKVKYYKSKVLEKNKEIATLEKKIKKLEKEIALKQLE